MTNNPYLDEIDRHYDPDDLSPDTLATLATATELREMNRLTAAANAPMRVVNNVQAPIPPEDLRSQKIMDLPDDSPYRRIVQAALRWQDAYHTRSDDPAQYRLASSVLAEVIRLEDER